MATNAQRKSNHNTLIRTETAISGVTREDIATSLDNLSDAIQGAFGTFTDGATITLDMANYHNWKGTIAGNRTIAFSNLSSGDCGIIFVKQDATGSRTLTWPGSAVLPTGGLSLSAGANEVTAIGFMYDGTSIFLSKENYGAVAGDTTPPSITSMRVENATPSRIDILYNEALNTGSTPATSAYTVTGKTVSSVVVTGSTVQVTVSVAFGSGDTVSLGYTVPGSNMVKDSAGNNAAAITLSTGNVTNAIGSALEDLTFSTAHGLSVASLNWSGSDASTYYQNWGVATKSIPASTDGYIRARYTATDGENAIIGIDSDATDERIKSAGTTQPFDWKAGAYVYSGTIYYFEAAVDITSTGVSISVGDYWRISRSGSVWKVQKSTDGTTWTDAVTLAYAGTGQTWLKANIDTFTVGTTKLYQPKGFNVS